MRLSTLRLSNPWLRGGLAFVLTLVVGGALWFDWEARLDGFAGWFDRRDAHAAGILAAVEWRAMRAAGDVAPASEGGEGCASEACRAAQAMLGGRWAGIGDCAAGDVYRFTDGFADVTSHRDGKPVETIRRRYRVVGAAVELRKGERRVVKQPGDVEVFTLGRSAYVRRIFRAADQDTLRLVLVEQRAGRSGAAAPLIVDGQPVAGGATVAYRRCPV